MGAGFASGFRFVSHPWFKGRAARAIYAFPRHNKQLQPRTRHAPQRHFQPRGWYP
jgi:hypothetical protein